jgi:hypothetical protein
MTGFQGTEHQITSASVEGAKSQQISTQWIGISAQATHTGQEM